MVFLKMVQKTFQQTTLVNAMLIDHEALKKGRVDTVQIAYSIKYRITQLCLPECSLFFLTYWLYYFL